MHLSLLEIFSLNIAIELFPQNKKIKMKDLSLNKKNANIYLKSTYRQINIFDGIVMQNFNPNAEEISIGKLDVYV